ncbi:hypothetical protein F4678DRAFT_433473 [Xylaria arbuscula]|nr:hypothetical protein F4678DRAFT_433473 [Xylaria arbuscula]
MADVYTENMTRLPNEVQRLNQQFDSLTKNIGYFLHPSITLPPTPHIADMATGTARFLDGIHRIYPDAILDGFDLSPELFPPQGTLSSKISLWVLDIKKPFPEHMHGQFDLVHVRLLVAAMRPEDWEPAVRNFSSILRPGGYLQWEECDFLGAEWLPGNPGASVDKMKHLGYTFRAALHDQLNHGWNTLPQHMQAAGLVSIVTDVASSDRDFKAREIYATSALTLFLNWAHLMIERGATGPMFNDLRDLEKAARQEIKSGCYFKFNIHVACGRKPM